MDFGNRLCEVLTNKGGDMFFELSSSVECPHCGESVGEVFQFDMDEANQEGVNSKYVESECYFCDFRFWSKSYCTFEVEVYEILKNNPKERK